MVKLNFIYKILPAILTSILINACSSSNLIYDYDHTQVFSDYKTFRFAGEDENDSYDILDKNKKLKDEIKTSVKAVLIENGFIYKEDTQTDLIVFIHSKERDTTDINYFHPWWQPCGATSVSKFENNSLILDIIDKRTGLIWRGIIQGFLTFGSNNSLTANISSLLGNFPPI